METTTKIYVVTSDDVVMGTFSTRKFAAIVNYPDGAEVTGQWGGEGAIENIPLTMLYEWDIPHIIAEIAEPK